MTHRYDARGAFGRVELQRTARMTAVHGIVRDDMTGAMSIADHRTAGAQNDAG